MAYRPFVCTLYGLSATPESGGLLYSYVQGTSTPLALYSDAGVTPTTNPVVADSLGQITPYFNDATAYSWTAKTADAATTLWQANVTSGVLTLTYVNPDIAVIHADWFAMLTKALAWVDVASASAVDLSSSANVRITGTTTITSLGTLSSGVERTLRFAAALTLTHNATSLILPSAGNITTAANDTATFKSLASGNWICTSYQRAVGDQPLSADLTAIDALTGTGLYDRTGDGSAALRTLHSSHRAIIAANRYGGSPTLTGETFVGTALTNDTQFALNWDITASSNTLREVTAQFIMRSSTGFANRSTAEKAALVAASLGDTSSGNVYAANFIGSGPAGTGGILVIAAESNCQNISSNHADTIGATTAAYGYLVTSGGNARCTAGLWITKSGSILFQYGSVIGSANLVGYYIESTCSATYAFMSAGTHTTALDFGGAVVSNAGLFPNNAGFLSKDTGGTARNMIVLNTSDILAVSATGIPVSILSTGAASSTTTGGLRVAGGVGIGGAAYIGGAVVASSTVTASGAITSSIDGSTGTSPLIAHNTNEANNTTKYVQALLRGEDTVGTIKDVGAIRANPADGNWADGTVSIYGRVSDALTEMFRCAGTYTEFLFPARMKSYTVATLPTGAAGDVAYASDGRKNGEGGGAGTGVIVFKDGTAWRAVDTGATAAA